MHMKASSGAIMKILAISNIPGATEKIADILESPDINIMAKEENSDIEGIRDRISYAFSKGTYDYAIVVVDNHIKATAILNKAEGITAAVFDSEEDMGLIEGSGINTIVVKASRKNPSFISSIISASTHLSNAPESASKIRFEKPSTQQHITPTQSKNHLHISLLNKDKKPEKQEKPNKAAQEESEVSPGSKRKGVMGKLKDSLGIID